MKKSKAKVTLVLLAFVFVTMLFAACKTTTPTVNLKLAELKAGDVTLVETDGKYVHSVGYEVGSLTLSATAKDSSATVEGTGEKTLTVGKNEFTVTVSKSGKTAEYAVEITRAAAVLDLTEVKIGDTVLTAGADGAYTLNVENSVKTITLSATAAKSYVEIEGLGEKTLAVGENTFTITVKAGGQSENYTVKVIRAAAELGLSEVKIGDEVLTALSDGTYKYTVANTVTEITLTAVAVNANATVAGAGVKQNLVVGENRFEITVSAGEENKTYTVIVVREKSSVNTIAEVKVNGNVVNYDDDENAYLVTVNDKNASIVVTLTSEVSSYVIAPATGTLTEGENEFTITVTAENGATAAYTLIIELVLPTYNVTYSGNIEGAVVSEGFTYKHGSAQTLNVTLDGKYTQSYNKITVTYKVGNGAEKTAVLDDNYGFTVPAEEAIGDIVVTVSGIEINVYTVTYHKGGATTTEKVKHGENATGYEITPNTESKEVLDGYVYTHDERWVTEENGIGVASFENVTKDMDVYYKDEILVSRDVKYYEPMGGAITYYTIRQMNAYVAGGQNGDVIFKVLVKSLATDGTPEEAGKTSFVIYGTATWNNANELGVSVSESELNKWFTVKATAADKKVTVYNPDGAVVAEKTFEAYAADTISLAMHADIAVAAVNPAIPEICTVTYLDENGDEIHSEKVIKGSASAYEYSKADKDMGKGYTGIYTGKWANIDGTDVDLTIVNESITVKYLITETLVYINLPKYDENSGYKTAMSVNKYIQPDEAGKIVFKVRLNNESGTAFNIYETTVWSADIVGVGQWVDVGDLGKTWYTVEFDSVTGVLKIYDGNGIADAGHTKTFTKKDCKGISVVVGAGSVDIAAVNPEEQKPFGTNIGEVFVESAADATVETPDLYEKVMKRTSYTADTFTTTDISGYTEIRFKTLYTKNWYLFDGGWGATDLDCTEWIEWQLVKNGETWTLNIYSDSKTYKTETGLTGSSLRDVFKNKWSDMKGGGIGSSDDYVWTTELRAK